MSKKGKKQKSSVKKQAEINRAMKQVEPIVIPLCEAFAVMDDVFTEEGAFSNEHIKKSLGRLHRAWKKTREALDPEFDPNDYERRPRKAGANPESPLATGSQPSSTARKPTSERSRKQSAKTGKRTAKTSVKGARSDGHASRGLS